jgi:hypothetical protein
MPQQAANEPAQVRADLPASWSRLISFMADHLLADEEIRGVLSGTETANSSAVALADIVNLGSVVQMIITRRAIVVTDQRAFVIRMPRFGSWSIEHVAPRESVEVIHATPSSLRLRFPGSGDAVYPFDESLRHDADGVVRALAGSADIRLRSPSAGTRSHPSEVDGTGVWPKQRTHRTAADWLALFLGLPLGVLLMLGVLVPLGEPDAAEVTFLFSLVVIVAGLAVGSLMRGWNSRRLVLAGDVILGLGLGVGIGFLLVFVAPGVS